MNPWLAFGIGVGVGIIGLFVVGGIVLIKASGESITKFFWR